MFNLLPKEEIRILKREYLLRYITAIFLVVGISALIGLSSLLPAYLLSSLKNKNVQNEQEAVKQLLELKERNDKFSGLLADLEEQLKLYKSGSDSLLPTELFEMTLSHKRGDIKINAFNFRTADKSNKTLVVSGIAKNRESLVSFVDSLKTEKKFSSVELPISNLAKSSNIDFSITIQGSFKR